MKPIDFKAVVSVFLSLLPDVIFLNKLYLKLIYFYGLGRYLNFKRVHSLNEKMQYLKLYDKDPLYTQICDKLRARDFVEKRVGEKYLIPLLLSGTDFNDITLKSLPEPPFIVKSNHDCSGGLVIRDINEPLLNVKGVSTYIENDASISVADSNIKYIQSFLKSRFNYNHYPLTKEWQYKNVEKAFVLEKLLQTESGNVPNDYKFHCINGVVEFIYVSVDREGANQRQIYYPNWKIAPFTWTKKGGEYKFKGCEVAEPLNLNEMLLVAQKLSEGFKYIRVDLYSDGAEIYFGELTLHQGSGIEPILPEKYDVFYGSKINL